MLQVMTLLWACLLIRCTGWAGMYVVRVQMFFKRDDSNNHSLLLTFQMGNIIR